MTGSPAALLEHLDRENPGDVVGVYLYGSAAAEGLRPDSDVDVLLLVRRSLTLAERKSLVALLLGLSGWRGHADRFPDVAARRPVELTAAVVEEGPAWRRRPRRGELIGGHLPQPVEDPDVIVMIATPRGSPARP